MNAAIITQAALANMVTHMSWVQRRAPGMTVVEDDQLVLIDSGMPCDTFNFVCQARLEESTLHHRIAQAIQFFKHKGHPFSWWVGPGDQPRHLGEALQEAGLDAMESELAMALDLSQLQIPSDRPAELRIERVTDHRQLMDFAAINAANWNPPDPHVLRFYETASPFLLSRSSPLWFYLGYIGQSPIATAELTIAGGVAGLYNICTLDGYRRRGIGTAMTVHPLLDARQAGLSAAILQAAADGVGVYSRIGFVNVGSYTEYKPRA